jgi:hypothetical protein
VSAGPRSSPLTPAALEVLTAAGFTALDWAVRHFDGPDWGGDVCGCTDDRCVGYHHGEDEECGCLPVLLDGATSS